MNDRSIAAAMLCILSCSGATVQAMGPNPGGKLGEDMPFESTEAAVRQAPAATAERQAAARGDAEAECAPPAGDEHAGQAKCPPQQAGEAKPQANDGQK
jgi:hypothetical protein